MARAGMLRVARPGPALPCPDPPFGDGCSILMMDEETSNLGSQRITVSAVLCAS
jgi:hypothetical protein